MRSRNGTYDVDRKGSRLADIPAFNLLIGSDDGVDDGDGDGDDDDEAGGEEEREDDLLDAAQCLQPGAQVVFPQGQQQQPQNNPPQAPPLNLQTVDELGRRNRIEAEGTSQQTLAMMLQMMNQQNQQQRQASQQQMQMHMQMLLAAMQSSQPKPADNSVMIGLATALAPILAKILEPKGPDPAMMLVLTEMLKKEKVAPSGGLLKEIPAIMGEVTRQQMALQQTGSQQTMAMSPQMNHLLMDQMTKNRR